MEPNFIVLFDIQVALQRIRERGVAVIEVAEIWAVNRGAWEDTRWNRRQHMARVGQRIGVRGMHGDNLITAC